MQEENMLFPFRCSTDTVAFSEPVVSEASGIINALFGGQHSPFVCAFWLQADLPF